MGNGASSSIDTSVCHPTNDEEKARLDAFVKKFKEPMKSVTAETLRNGVDPLFTVDVQKYSDFCTLALREHKELAGLQRQLVPTKMKEQAFWSAYFQQLLNGAAAAAKASSNKAVSKEKKAKKKRKKKKKDAEDTDVTQIKEVLLTIRECFVYQVPPMRRATGHVCKSWGLDNPLWTGQMKVMACDTVAWLEFVTSSGELFVRSRDIPVDTVTAATLDRWIEPAKDSSRYFVVLCVNPNTKQQRPLGFGFRERSSAFDLNAALTDKMKKLQRQSDVLDADFEDLWNDDDVPADDDEKKSGHELSGRKPSQFALKGDQKIRVAWRVAGSKPPKRRAKHRPAGGGGLVKLAPPPAAATPAVGQEDDAQAADDEWGDFDDVPQVSNDDTTGDDDWGDFK